MQPLRRRRLDYATQIDPVMSTFGWRVIGLTYVAVLVPILGALLPRGTGTRWPWLLIALAGATATLAVNGVHLRRMIRSRGYWEPPPLLVLAEVTVGTVSAGILDYAIGGPAGLYRPLVFIPTLLLAMIGNRTMIAVSWAVALVSVTWPSVASGAIDGVTPAYVVSYGAAWGIAAVMVHMLALASLRSDRQNLGLAEVAGIAARASRLSEGVAEVVPAIAGWSGAARVAAYRVASDDRGSEGDRSDSYVDADLALLEAWSAEAVVAAAVPPHPEEVAAARAHDGVFREGERAVLVAEGGDGELLVLALDGLSRPGLDLLVDRFNFERMVLQLGALVNRTSYIGRLEELSRTDGLTGLPNRRDLGMRIEEACRSAAREDGPLSLVMIDLDWFKRFNDTHGHLAGDRVLQGFAELFRSRLRTGDVVARYGGEEFCMLLPHTDLAGAVSVIEGLRAAAGKHPALAEVGFSAGLACWAGEEPPEALLDRADAAMYAAKAAGRGRVGISRLAGDRRSEEVLPAEGA